MTNRLKIDPIESSKRGRILKTEDSVLDEPLKFIQDCVRKRHLFWTYHVNMRMKGRYIRRETILSAVDGYKIIEAYPKDKYLPSYLILSEHEMETFHVLFAIDEESGNVRIITAYRPDSAEWEPDLRTRRRKK